jgi:hypothetical protein
MAAPANNHQAAPASGALVLPVPYFCQRDSASGEGLRLVRQFGDTTEAHAQVQAPRRPLEPGDRLGSGPRSGVDARPQRRGPADWRRVCEQRDRQRLVAGSCRLSAGGESSGVFA